MEDFATAVLLEEVIRTWEMVHRFPALSLGTVRIWWNKLIISSLLLCKSISSVIFPINIILEHYFHRKFSASVGFSTQAISSNAKWQWQCLDSMKFSINHSTCSYYSPCVGILSRFGNLLEWACFLGCFMLLFYSLLCIKIKSFYFYYLSCRQRFFFVYIDGILITCKWLF